MRTDPDLTPPLVDSAGRTLTRRAAGGLLVLAASGLIVPATAAGPRPARKHKHHKPPKSVSVTEANDPAEGEIVIPESGYALTSPSRATVAQHALRHATVTKVTVGLRGFTHTYPDDLEIMLAGPQDAVKVLLMAHVGGDVDADLWDLDFADDGADGVLTPETALRNGGHYRPSVGGATTLRANQTTLAAFNGGPVNGLWSLYVYDAKTPDSGSIARWYVAIEAEVPR